MNLHPPIRLWKSFESKLRIQAMCIDALERDESCGGHFRVEHQTPEGEAKRNDENFANVFAWEYQGNGKIAPPKLHREPLHFETVQLTQRSYK